MKLNNKIVVVTGGSQGLGAAVADKLARDGARLILIARREKYLKVVVKKIGLGTKYYCCDIRKLEEIKGVVGEIKNKYKHVDVLINNAGVWTDEELEIKNSEMRRQAFETNTLGHINFTKEILRLMDKNNGGHIFNVISTGGASDTPAGFNEMWQTYGASKWAMRGFTNGLRRSLDGTKIKVTGFFPGGFESNLYENAGRPNPHNQPWMMKTEDVADMIIFCLTRPDDVQVETLVVTKFS